MIISGASTPDQDGPGSDGSEGVLCILQSSSITKTSLCLESYLGHSFGSSVYSSAEKQSAYFTAPFDWARLSKELNH